MKELKTRSELMAELEEEVEVIRKHFSSACDHVAIHESINRTLRIDLYECADGNIYGNEFKYIPDPVAPDKGRAVISKSGMLWVSYGEFYGDELRVFDYSESRGIGLIKHWCDYLNRDHHSPGWEKEWEPRE